MAENNNCILHNYLANMSLDIFLAVNCAIAASCEHSGTRIHTNRIYYICGGEYIFKINSELITAREGDLVIAPKDSVIDFSSTDGEKHEMFICHFTAECDHCNLFEYLEFPYSTTLGNERAEWYVRHSFEDLVHYNTINDVQAAFRVQADLLKILACFVDHTENERPTIKINKDKTLKPIISYIEENYKNDITVNELAQAAHLHPNYFIKTFKKQFGIPPIQYINRLRLTKARYALTNTAESIQEIAVNSGFNGQSQFSKAFRQMFGLSPSEYRRLYSDTAHA